MMTMKGGVLMIERASIYDTEAMDKIIKANRYADLKRQRRKSTARLVLLVIFNAQEDRILMQRHDEKPYFGQYALLGGKIALKADLQCAAYDVLEEATGLLREDIRLVELMHTEYYADKCMVDVLAGKLNKDLYVFGNGMALEWVSRTENFNDQEKFAGRGLIGHIMEHVNMAADLVFEDADVESPE